MKPARSKAYLDYVRSHASCLWWEHPSEPLLEENVETVAHHVRMGANEGLGQKPSDFRCVPLADSEHRTLHDRGEGVFWLSMGVDPYEVMTWLLYWWVRNKGIDLIRPPKVMATKCFGDILAVAEALNEVEN